MTDQKPITGARASIRVNALTLDGQGDKTLATMEAHGKREDATSRARKVRDRDPLVWGSLDLREAYEAHVAGCRMNAALKKPVLHAIIQFPRDLEITNGLEYRMLHEAVAFINQTHGGDAVFAARLDRDEAGRHNVDVFYSPKYLKHTARSRRGEKDPETWISTSKHGKELCAKHREEITRRSRSGKFATGPRQVGIALQSELRAHLCQTPIVCFAGALPGSGMGDRIASMAPKVEKVSPAPDRVDPETYKARRDAQRDRAAAAEAVRQAQVEAEAAARARAEAEADHAAAAQARHEAEAWRAEVAEAQAQLARDRAALDAERQRLEASQRAADALLGQLTSELGEVRRFRGYIQRLADLVVSLVTPVAQRLGVKPELAAVEEAIRDIDALPEPAPRPRQPSMIDALKAAADRFKTTEKNVNASPRAAEQDKPDGP